MSTAKTPPPQDLDQDVAGGDMSLSEKRNGGKRRKKRELKNEPAWQLEPGDQKAVLLFGKTGSGKSALGNLLIGRNVFTSNSSFASVTNFESVKIASAHDDSLTVYDSIGLGDTNLREEDVVKSIRDMAYSAANGFDLLIYVMKLERFGDHELSRFNFIMQYLWGPECIDYMLVAITYADGMALWDQEQTAKWIQEQAKQSSQFKAMLGFLGSNPNKFVFIDNPDMEAARDDMDLIKAYHRKRQASCKAVTLKIKQHLLPKFQNELMSQALQMERLAVEKLPPELVTIYEDQKKYRKLKKKALALREFLKEQKQMSKISGFKDLVDSDEVDMIEEELAELEAWEACLPRRDSRTSRVAEDVEQTVTEEVKSGLEPKVKKVCISKFKAAIKNGTKSLASTAKKILPFVAAGAIAAV